MGAAVTLSIGTHHTINIGTQHSSSFEALSDAVATGLILGIGLGGSLVLVLGLTIRAARLSNRERRQAAANRPQIHPVRHIRRNRSRSAAGVDTAGYDPYPPQPYSAHEPTSHKPYSRPYRVPAQDQQATHAKSNGSRPVGSTGQISNTPWQPPED